jgi:hypothetical protein
MKNTVPLSIIAVFMLLNTVPASAQYCASKSSNPWELWIKKVSLNTINYESGKFKEYSSLGYSDFTTINTTLTKGSEYILSTEAGLSWSGILTNAHCRAWIDWNRNNTFEETELVLQNTNAFPFVNAFRVPISAQVGATRMRIAVKIGDFPRLCENFGAGEVEDYTVTIAEAESLSDTTRIQIMSASIVSNSARPGETVAVNLKLINNSTIPNSPAKTLKLSTGTSRSGKRSESYEYTGISNDVPIGVSIQPNETLSLTRHFIINPDYSKPSYPTPFEAFARNQGTFVGISTAKSLSSFSARDTFPYPLPINIVLPYADLEVSMSPTAPVYTGKEINYTVKVKNKSSDSVSKVEVRLFNLGYYTYDSVRLTPSKGTTVAYNSVGEIYTVAGYWYAGTLAPNEEATCTVFLSSNFWTVSGINPDIRADVQSLTRFDTITANNSANLSFTRVIASQPDLTLTNLNLSTPSVSQGQILNFRFDAKNIGISDATTGFSIKSYLSRDTILDNMDYQDGTISTGNYTVGTAISNIQGAMRVSDNLSIGDYYLILKIDADNQITESNELNNTVVTPVRVITAGGGTGGGNGTNDIALSLVSTPSVYRQYRVQNFKISAKNNSNQAFTDVKIDFPYPTKTVSGGVVTPSVGTWQEWCAGGTQCYMWIIPSLAANTTATLDVPVYVLDAVGMLTATTHLLSSNPVDNNTVNNSLTVSIGSANAPLIAPLINSKPIELNGLINQRISPTIADNYIVLELESNADKQINCQIINSLGSVVLSKQLMLGTGNNAFNFTVSQLPKGMYFIQTNIGQMPMKFVRY